MIAHHRCYRCNIPTTNHLGNGIYECDNCKASKQQKIKDFKNKRA